MTHLQWIYKNSAIHYAVKEGQTAVAHETILGTFEGFLHTDPGQLLKEHHCLLFSDFVAVASGSTKDKLEWIAKNDSALGAAAHVARGSKHAVWMHYCCNRCPWMQMEYKSVLVDAERSIRWHLGCKQV
jgi:hypothetical protein